MPDSILGYTVTLNSHAPVPAANAKSIAFGDLKAYTIRDVTSSVLLQRYTDSAYAKKGQVGFHQWSRHGGALLDNAAVKLYQHPAA
jgi:HK97 family phage major capsid protein